MKAVLAVCQCVPRALPALLTIQHLRLHQLTPLGYPVIHSHVTLSPLNPLSSLPLSVAVDDFNMGAMENKSLNIFNSRLVLASPQTATDMDYKLIEAVVGHEYFHNWTGNRVTCRDWFQLTLKEGLTVYRWACGSGGGCGAGCACGDVLVCI